MTGIPEQPQTPRRAPAQRREERSEELRRVDAALDAIGVRGALSWGDDEELPDPLEQDAALSLLLALRADIDEAISAATAHPLFEEPVAQVVPLRSRLTRRGVAVVGTAALVVSLGGVAAAAVTSSPGSPLYGLHRVLTGAPANPAEEQLRAVSRLLDQADAATTAGRYVAADALLTDAGRRLDAIGTVDGADALRHRLNELLAALDAARLAAAGREQPATAAGQGREPDTTSVGAQQAAEHRAAQTTQHGKPATAPSHVTGGKSGSHQPSGHGGAPGSNSGAGHGANTTSHGNSGSTAPSDHVTTPPRPITPGSASNRATPPRPTDTTLRTAPSGH